MLTDEIKKIYSNVSVATICTALFKRGLRNQFIQDVLPLNYNLPNMVGLAYTVRYIPAREDLNSLEVFKDPDHPQRVAIEECPSDHVIVFDSRKDARAASAGAILITRLMVRGCAGVVTDGGFRDSHEIKNINNWSVLSNTDSYDSDVELSHVVFTNNTVHDVSGGIAFRGKLGEEIQTAVITGNTADYSMYEVSNAWAFVEVNKVLDIEISNNVVHGVPRPPHRNHRAGCRKPADTRL
jgi:hypothetical protein